MASLFSAPRRNSSRGRSRFLGHNFGQGVSFLRPPAANPFPHLSPSSTLGSHSTVAPGAPAGGFGSGRPAGGGGLAAALAGAAPPGGPQPGDVPAPGVAPPVEPPPAPVAQPPHPFPVGAPPP